MKIIKLFKTFGVVSGNPKSEIESCILRNRIPAIKHIRIRAIFSIVSKKFYFLSLEIKKNGSVNVAYFGTPDYSRQLLEKISLQHTIICVVSTPDKISDRTRTLKPSPVSEFALQNNWTLFRPENLKDPSFVEKFLDLNIDIGVVFSYGKIIPEIIFKKPKYGCINLHGSLLPDLRGASPIQTAIMKGYKKSGWTVQIVSKGLDEGDILDQEEFEIFDDETTQEVMSRVLDQGIKIVLKVMEHIEYYLQNAKKQNSEKATYCSKINHEQSFIHWNDFSIVIHNLVRALNPNPIAKTTLKKAYTNEKISNIKIYRTNYKIDPHLETQLNKTLNPGFLQIIKWNKFYRLFVKTKDHFLEVLELQYPNKNKLLAHDFINGKFLQQGDSFI